MFISVTYLIMTTSISELMKPSNHLVKVLPKSIEPSFGAVTSNNGSLSVAIRWAGREDLIKQKFTSVPHKLAE